MYHDTTDLSYSAHCYDQDLSCESSETGLKKCRSDRFLRLSSMFRGDAIRPGPETGGASWGFSGNLGIDTDNPARFLFLMDDLLPGCPGALGGLLDGTAALGGRALSALMLLRLPGTLAATGCCS